MTIQTADKHSVLPKTRASHTRPQAPIIDLNQPGRLRVAHVMSLLGISHATLYAGLKTGRYPAPDGRDGRIPFWRTERIRNFLKS
jgi:predicted DNA-binding transcriptional regulator AlpA